VLICNWLCSEEWNDEVRLLSDGDDDVAGHIFECKSNIALMRDLTSTFVVQLPEVNVMDCVDKDYFVNLTSSELLFSLSLLF